MALTRLAHSLVRKHFEERHKGLAIDATCGNGHDTEFLARLGFKKVLAFDVQDLAINNTRDRLAEAQLTSVTLILDGHQNLLDHVSSPISCAMFNFGYLPKADKQLTTQTDTSLVALAAAVLHLSDDGIICLICYPGHPTGKHETQAIQLWLAELKGVSVTEYLSSTPKPASPVLYTIIPDR